jgi:hypothetical protein
MEALVKVGMGLCLAVLLVLFAWIWTDRRR